MISESAYLTDENLRFILNDIGDKLFAIAPPEMLENSPAYKAIIAEWEAQLREQEKITRQAREKEEKAKQIEAIARQTEVIARESAVRALQTQRRALLRTLKHRFGELPDSVVARIEATDNPDLLEEWLDMAFEVDSLAEFSRQSRKLD